MSRGSHYLFIALMILSPPLFAQTRIGPNGPVTENQKRNPDNVIVRKLTITPAAKPTPPLKHSMFPRANELKPGNSVPIWYRTLGELKGGADPIGELYNRVTRDYDNPDAGPFPSEEVRDLTTRYERVFESAREAAFRHRTDWDLQLGELRGPDTIWFLLGEFQDARQLARLLYLRSALAVEEGDFDSALEDFQIAFRLAVDVAKPETYINDLIGIAIYAILFENVERMISTPDSPNLYWAFAQLPNPLIEIRTATEFEMTLPERYFEWLKNPLAEERTSEEWNQLHYDVIRNSAQLGEVFPNIHEDSSDDEVAAAFQTYALREYPNAVQFLTDHGWSEKEVADMPTGKVLALREHYLYEQYTQQFAANLLLPFPESQKRYEQLRESLDAIHRKSIVRMLLPSVQQVYVAQQRREAFKNVYMLIEAIRMHIAESDGKLPRSLDEVTVVPIPEFPFTGKPFDYRLEGDTAIIDVPIPRWHNRFEIRVK